MRDLVLRTAVLFLTGLTSAAGQNTAFIADGNPGDPVAEGQHAYFTAGGGTFTVAKNYLNGVDFGFSNNTNASWNLEFAAPDDAPLEVQNYPNAAAFGTSGSPGLQVSFNSSACSQVSGEFNVLEIVYAADGEIEAFHATFTQYLLGSQRCAHR